MLLQTFDGVAGKFRQKWTLRLIV